MVKIVKQTYSKAEELSKAPHVLRLAYRVTLRGPGKLSPAEAVTCLESELTIHQTTSVWPADHNQRSCCNRDKQQADQYHCTSWQLQELTQHYPIWIQLDSSLWMWQKTVVIFTCTDKALRVSIRFRPALEPDRLGTKSSYYQQWNLPIQNHLHQCNHQQTCCCHHLPVQVPNTHDLCTALATACISTTVTGISI